MKPIGSTRPCQPTVTEASSWTAKTTTITAIARRSARSPVIAWVHSAQAERPRTAPKNRSSGPWMAISGTSSAAHTPAQITAAPVPIATGRSGRRISAHSRMPIASRPTWPADSISAATSVTVPCGEANASTSVLAASRAKEIDHSRQTRLSRSTAAR